MYSTGGASAASSRSRRMRASNSRAPLGRRVGLGADRQHRHRVAHRRERRERRAADALRRRIGRDERGYSAFERLELAKQRVVLGVADRRRVVDVVRRGCARRSLRATHRRALPPLRGPRAATWPRTLSLPRLRAEQRQRARAARLDVHARAAPRRRPSTCSRIAASAASSSGRWLSSTSSPPSVCAIRLAASFIWSNVRTGSAVAGDVEQEHDAARRRQPQRVGRERLVAQVLQRIDDRARLLVRRSSKRPPGARRKPAASATPRSRVPAIGARLRLQHGEADLHVEVGAQAIERLGARSLAVRRRADERRRQRRRELADDADEGVELRTRRGAVAVGEQQARGDLVERAGRVWPERCQPTPCRAAEPAQRLAEPRVQARGDRPRGDRLRRLQRDRCIRSRDRAATPVARPARREGARRRMHDGRRRIDRRVRVGCQRFHVVGRCGDYVDGRLELARGIRAAAKRRGRRRARLASPPTRRAWARRASAARGRLGTSTGAAGAARRADAPLLPPVVDR